MLIEIPEIVKKYDLKIKGVIQVGCHWSEEHSVFEQLGITKIVYIEPCKEAFEIIKAKFNGNKDIVLHKVACGSKEGEYTMFVSHNNQGQSNSLLRPNLHLQQHPEVVFNDHENVKVVLLDNIIENKDDYNLLMLDVQGFEGEVLIGGIETAEKMDCIYTECNRGQTYSGNMEIEQMDLLLESIGFIRTDTYWPSPNWTWGDCIYIRQSLLK